MLGSEGDQQARYTISECPAKTERQHCCGMSHYLKRLMIYLQSQVVLYIPVGQSDPMKQRLHDDAVRTSPTEHWTLLPNDPEANIPAITHLSSLGGQIRKT